MIISIIIIVYILLYILTYYLNKKILTKRFGEWTAADILFNSAISLSLLYSTLIIYVLYITDSTRKL